MRVFKDHRPFYGQDPFFVVSGNTCLYIESNNESFIQIRETPTLKDLHDGPVLKVWHDTKEQQVWAPELHLIDGKWYIYYAASDGNNANHRTYVLEGDTPFGPFTKHQIGPDIWGIDMTTFTYHGCRYAVWSGWEKNGDEFPQNLYIAEMESPIKLKTDRVKIAAPLFDWEQSHERINEGPQAIISPRGTLYLTFSANASWTTEYSTGLMKLIGTDPLNPVHWHKYYRPLAENFGHAQLLAII